MVAGVNLADAAPPRAPCEDGEDDEKNPREQRAAERQAERRS
jgi:hypothetical protein